MQEYFPFTTPRPGQIEIINEIAHNFLIKKFVFFEGETGIGKSPIAVTLANYLGSAYYLTHQVQLQDQLYKDFGPEGHSLFSRMNPMVKVKGRSRYKCTYLDAIGFDGKLSDTVPSDYQGDCRNGVCMINDRSLCDECIEARSCPYYESKKSGGAARLTNMNYHAFVYLVAWFNNEMFDFPRNLLTMDEGHNVEGILGSIIGVSLLEDVFHESDIYFPGFGKKPTVQQIADWMREAGWDHKAKEICEAHGEAAERKGWSQINRFFLRVVTNPGNWLASFDTYEHKGMQYNRIDFSPIDVSEFASKAFYPFGDKILITSATLLNFSFMCKLLGVPEEQAAWVSADNGFPPKRSPIVFAPSGSMKVSGGFQERTMPNLVQDIEAIADAFPNQRGIIHSVSHGRTKDVYYKASPKLRKRLIRIDDGKGDKALMLKKHQDSHNGILINPAIYEGIEFPGDAGRFQIFIKTPFLPPDAMMKAKMERFPRYYEYNVALKLIQGFGRLMRSKDDWGVTFVLDDDFINFFQGRGSSFFKQKFCDMLIYHGGRFSNNPVDYRKAIQ